MERYKPLFEREDYVGFHNPPGNNGYSKPIYDLTDMFPDDIYSKDGARYYGDGDVPMDNLSISIIRGLRGTPNAKVTIYRAVPALLTTQEKIDDMEKQKKYILKNGKIPSYIKTTLGKSDYYDKISDEIDELIVKGVTNEKKTKINKGDWVTINPQYAKEHGESNLDRYRILRKTVRAKDIYSDGDSIHEWGYDPS